MRDGFQHFEPVLSRDEIRGFIDQLSEVKGGARQTELPHSLAASLAKHARLSRIADDVLGARSRLVRVLLFDKTPGANWGVPWHQDRSIAVRERADVPGYSCWTGRDGYWQVEPPIAILETMVTLRVHIDHCGTQAGPLAVIPASHLGGRMTQQDITEIVKHADQHICIAAAGDVLAMRPLLVHSSRRALSPEHRRVIHLEYAPRDLKQPFKWALGADSVAPGA